MLEALIIYLENKDRHVLNWMVQYMMCDSFL